MTDTQPDPVATTRKTISLTHRQAGVVGTGVALSMLLSNMDTLNSLFTTKAEGQATAAAVSELKVSTNQRFDRIEQLIENRSAEIKDGLREYSQDSAAQFRRKSETDDRKFLEIDARREKGDDRLEAEIRDLNAFVFKKPRTGG